jgi:hypothetical protein
MDIIGINIIHAKEQFNNVTVAPLWQRDQGGSFATCPYSLGNVNTIDFQEQFNQIHMSFGCSDL